MNRLLLVVAVVGLAAALTLPSGAAPLFDDPDDIGENVELAPAPDSPYAELNEDGELVVDLSAADAEGVNRGSISSFEEVFHVRYAGDRFAHVWIEDSSEAVTIVSDGEPIDAEANNVTLGPNQSAPVGIVVDTRGDVEGQLIESVEVNAKVADPEDISDDPGEIDDPNAEAVQMRVVSPSERSVLITPGADGPVPVVMADLEIDGPPLILESVQVERRPGRIVEFDAKVWPSDRTPEGVPDPTATVLGTVEFTERQPGDVSDATLAFSVDREYLTEHDVDAEDLTVFRRSNGEWSALSLTVVERSEERVRFRTHSSGGFSTFVVGAERPSVVVSEASLSTETVEPGGGVTVSAVVRNDGGAAGERTVPILVDGEPSANRTVELGPGESTELTATVQAPDSGAAEIAVGDHSAGTITVDDADEPTATPAAAEQPTATGPVLAEEPGGFGLERVLGLALLLAIVFATVSLVRRLPRR